MGFYGSVVSTTKTPFTYDRIYTTRANMEEACEEDGVFLGRYVLVEYDESTVKGYYSNGVFYKDAEKTQVMPGEEKVLYQNLLEVSGFYTYSVSSKKWNKITSGANSAYSYNYDIDVKKYGRGYDSTVWIKHYDVTTNKYHYLLMAELNATTPTFHLIHDAPQEVAGAPYFDENSSNLDYYLHNEVAFTNRVKATDAEHPHSDIIVRRPKVSWSYDANNNETRVEEGYEDINAAVYFNKAGFNKETRVYKDDSASEDGFGYTLSASGRRYSAPVLGNAGGTIANDTKNWYLYLPSLGNAICELWDDIYGRDRKLTVPTERNQSNVNYDEATIFGFCNTVRDLIGYTLKEKGSAPNTKNEVDNNLYYEDNKYYYYASNLDGTIYTLKEIPAAETTVYGLITTMHRLMGTGESLTEPTTIISCLNKMKDLLAKFDDPFAASKLVCTDESGKITSSDTSFPVKDSTQVLQGSGVWKYVSEMSLNGYQSTHDNTIVQEQYSINKAFDEVTGAIKLNKDNLATEVARATAEGQTLLNAINTEASRADAAEKANATLIDSEGKRALAAEQALDGKITTEVKTLDDAIKAEVSRAQGEEQKNANAITAETNRATEAENKNAQAISTEESRAKAQEEAIVASVTQEKDRATAAETENKNAIAAEASRADAAEKLNAKAISDEVTRAKAAEEANAKAIGDESTRAAAVEQANAKAIGDETTRATAAEKALQDRLDIMDSENHNARIKALEDAKYGDSISTLNATVANHGTSITNMSGYGDRIQTIENDYVQSTQLTTLKEMIWVDLQTNFNITLNKPVCTVGLSESGDMLTIAYGTLQREQLTVNLEYKNEEESEFAVTESAPAQDKDSFTMTQNGTYRIRIVRVHNGFTSEWTSTEHVYTVPVEE